MYLPGVSQKEYSKYDPVYLKVVKLDSTQTLLPYKYYELPFCKPEEGIKDMIGNQKEPQFSGHFPPLFFVMFSFR